MEPESMVHALEQIHNLLKPGGHLIDIHPSGEQFEFIYPFEGHEYFIGYLQETDDYIEYRQADEALGVAVSMGPFQLEKTGEFVFHTYGNTFDNLKAFLDENWSDAVISEDVITNVRKLERSYGKRAVFLRERVCITVLKFRQPSS